jgi:predicted amidohydrolase YtcJ
METRNRRRVADKGRNSVWALAVCVVIGVAIAACGDSRPEPADTVFRSGYVYTVDDHDRVVSSVAVRQGMIVYTGSDAGVQAFVGSATKVVDLGGRMMMPGLVDGHMHPLAGGRALLQCDLAYQTLTRSQMASAIQACLDDSQSKEPDAWLEVVNWLRQGTQAVDADPDKSTLDALKSQRPILVRSSDFHTVLTNSRGLAIAGITSATPDPAGGVFDRDASGNPTGICEDAAGWEVSASIPPDTDVDRVNQARAALSALRGQGITTLMDAAAGAAQAQAFTTLQQSGELTARGFFAVQLSPDDAAADPAKTVADAKAIADAWDQGEPGVAPGLRFRHLKMFGDGVVNAPADTGALLTPYFTNAGTEAAPNWVPGTNLGNLYFAPDVLKKLMVEIARSGMDPHIHATGERTVRTALDAFAYARQQVPGSDFRPAIAHDETVDPADYVRFHDLDVTATFSFQWAQQAPYSVGETANELGPARFARLEPSGSLVNAGARVAFGSDWPIDPFDEMLALKIGVTRSGDPQNPHSFGPDFAGKINTDPGLTRAAVLRAITMNAAYQLRMEHKVGSIEVGKFADLIVLERNFMQVPEDQLARNQVLLTMVGGKVVNALDPFATLMPPASHAAARLRILNASASTGHAVNPWGRSGVHGDGHNH